MTVMIHNGAIYIGACKQEGRCKVPEIPELEKYRKWLAQLVVGQCIRSLYVRRESWLNVDLHSMSTGIMGRQILYIERRGPDLIFHLDDGRRLIIRMGHGAQLTVCPIDSLVNRDVKGRSDKAIPSTKAIANSQLTITTEQAAMVMNNARACQLQWLTVKELDALQEDLGPDPLSRHLTAKRFQQRFAKRRTALKTALMNPSILVGIGSQYADEIAFAAGLLPTVRTDQLRGEHWQRLFYAMLDVYDRAIRREEIATASDTAKQNEMPTTGEAAATTIHGKIGAPCPRCGTALEVTMIQRRPANFCPHCQVNPALHDL